MQTTMIIGQQLAGVHQASSSKLNPYESRSATSIGGGSELGLSGKRSAKSTASRPGFDRLGRRRGLRATAGFAGDGSVAQQEPDQDLRGCDGGPGNTSAGAWWEECGESSSDGDARQETMPGAATTDTTGGVSWWSDL